MEWGIVKFVKNGKESQKSGRMGIGQEKKGVGSSILIAIDKGGGVKI